MLDCNNNSLFIKILCTFTVINHLIKSKFHVDRSDKQGLVILFTLLGKAAGFLSHLHFLFYCNYFFITMIKLKRRIRGPLTEEWLSI